MDAKRQEQKEAEARSEGFNYNLDYMAGEIGGSYTDELRDIMGLETFNYNEDILFKLIDMKGIDLTDEDIPAGKTYLARCTAKENVPDYYMCSNPNNEGYAHWVPVNEEKNR